MKRTLIGKEWLQWILFYKSETDKDWIYYYDKVNKRMNKYNGIK